MPAYDVVVYGTTLPALSAAIRYAREQPTKTVVAIGEWGRTGGMVTGGLTVSDEVDEAVYWGLTEEFFKGIGSRYGLTDAYAWRFAASTAQVQLDAMVAGAPNLTLVLGEYLTGVTMDGATILSLETDQNTYSGQHFICGNYEADLSAAAGVPMQVGREADTRYGEARGGLRHDQVDEIATRPTRRVDGSLQSPNGYRPFLQTGEADVKMMENNYRLQLSSTANRIPWPEPPNYSEDFWSRELAPDPRNLGQVLSLQVLPFDPDTHVQTNFNSIGGDFVYGWSEATHPERVAMKARHYDYFMGTLYYLATGANRPQAAKDTFAEWGLHETEFQTDFYHVPGMSPELYVRESRRIIGREVLTEINALMNPEIADAVCTGGYFMDRHTVQKYPQSDGTGTAAEGHTGYKNRQYYSIGFNHMRPVAAVCDNLLTVWGMSASSVLWSSLRMEPTLMMVGDVAGLAMARADDLGIKTGALTYNDILPSITAKNAVLRFELEA